MDTQSEPLFTVIITTYNRAGLLPRAIRSVLEQACGDFELLVVDNGSTDNTRAVVGAHADSRVLYVRNPQPSGSCDAPRNLGIARARGRYVAFLDDDDMWYPQRLERVKAAFDAHPEAAAVCHDEYLRVDGRGRELLSHGPGPGSLRETLLYDRNCMSSCGTTIRAEVLRELQGFVLKPELDGAADYDLWLRMAARGAQIFFLKEPLGEFSQTGENWSERDPGFGAKVAYIVRTHLCAHEGRPFSRLSRRAMWRLFELYVLAARGFLRSGARPQALAYGARSMECLVRRPALLAELTRRVARP